MIGLGRWVRALPASALPPGEARHVRVGGRDLALFHDRGGVFATDDACPHQGGSLGEGTLHEGRVICPWHHWVFDVRDGSCVHAPGISLATYAARFRDGEIEVELPEVESGENDDRQASG